MRTPVFILFLFGNLFLSAQENVLDLQGHRGCRGLMPENSLPGFIRAVDLGVTTLELDVVISKDSLVVVSHDPVLSDAFCFDKHCEPLNADSESRIFKLTYADVREYNCGCGGNLRFPEQKKLSVYKPLLSEVFDSVESYVSHNNLREPKYNVEIKSTMKGDNRLTPAPDDFVRLVLQLIEEKQLTERIIIQSFDVRALQAVKKQNAKIRTALLVSNLHGFNKNIRHLGFKPDIYSPYHKLVKKKLIKKARAENILVIPWTVNDLETMQKLIKLGVDGIISDYPNKFKQL